MRDARYDRQEATKPLGPYGWIQWKGTDVCMDVYCVCGEHGHIDHEFAYKYKCLACGKLFDVSAYVSLIEVPESEITRDDRDGCCVVSDESLLSNMRI